MLSRSAQEEEEEEVNIEALLVKFELNIFKKNYEIEGDLTLRGRKI